MAYTHIIRGQKIRQASQRRYIVVACRPVAVEARRWDHRAVTVVTRDDGTTYEQTGAYVPETLQPIPAYVVGRSDNAETARKRAARTRITAGWVVVWDTVTESEV